ncbi:hypothetical protein Dda_2224 [Drechslerella dactyloides]|uniref:Tc1-like transposase DDE domain-containing protein n=1 Tax=Drechslerella dactyloides TaxID=74499 RepID=A0AAD6J770_DREDA|nr:hypothetical protein Dda_5656 [Drechslerella dactyloides]KAJ6263656.1 hypothetical protein Dda_2224 [Drechslerella dactyloides]
MSAIIRIKKEQHTQQLTTPQKAGIQAIYSFCKAKQLPCTQRDLAEFYGRSTRTINKALNSTTTRRHAIVEEFRGRPPIVTPSQLALQDQIFQTTGWDARTMSHEALAFEMGVPVSRRTIVRYMHKINYTNCIACEANYLTPAACERRLAYARLMLDRYPEAKDWHHVRFSDETHFGFGSEDKVRIWRKPGERHLPQCMHWKRNPKEDYARLHMWAAIGHDFKSEPVFYSTTNTNGKMSNTVYVQQILEPVVLPWLEEAGQDFVLEEDNDSGHGTGHYSEAARWKQDHGLRHYFNCSQSPDLSPIENAWQLPKSYTRQAPHWDTESTRELVIQGWDSLKQETINKWVDSMPARLQAVIDVDGKMTHY